LEEYLKTSLRVKRPPLQQEEYSNMAYSLIGYLVEKLSGKPFKTRMYGACLEAKQSLSMKIR